MLFRGLGKSRWNNLTFLGSGYLMHLVGYLYEDGSKPLNPRKG
jgi:hypothetical protein